MKSVSSVKQSEIKEQWYLVDAAGQRIGVLASKVAEILMGKNNPLMKSYHKPANHVVIINAKNIDFTAKRAITKFFKNYSGYPGGLRFTNLEETHAKDPGKPLEQAIKGMLPRSKRGDLMFGNLKIFADDKHIHEAQKPEVVNLKKFKV